MAFFVVVKQAIHIIPRKSKEFIELIEALRIRQRLKVGPYLDERYFQSTVKKALCKMLVNTSMFECSEQQKQEICGEKIGNPRCFFDYGEKG